MVKGKAEGKATCSNEEGSIFHCNGKDWVIGLGVRENLLPHKAISSIDQRGRAVWGIFSPALMRQ